MPALRRGSAVARRHGGGGPVPPPFARTQTATKRLFEEHELIWDDGVAAETCLDFDCAHLPAWWTAPVWAGGLGFIACFIGAVALSDPAAANPVVPKTFPFNNLEVEKGRVAAPSGDDEEDDEEDDE